jgi:hypothetical protein
MKQLLLVILATVGVGCSGSGTDAPTERQTASQAPDPARPATSSDPACPATCAPADQKAASSPIARCEGQFLWDYAGTNDKQWLHRTPDGCVLGAKTLLRPDGSVTTSDKPPLVGRWSGDEFYFTVHLEDAPGHAAFSYDYERVAAAQPSTTP